MRAILILVIAFLLASCDYYIVNPHHHQVGHIDMDGSDPTDFNPCFKEKLFAHHTAWNRYWVYKYPPGKDSLRLYYDKLFDNQGIVNQSGYITLRFVINCKGEAGYFEIEELGLDYKKKKFNPELTNHLLELTKSIAKWHPYTHGAVSYTHLTLPTTPYV